MKTVLIIFSSLLIVANIFGQEKDWRLYGSGQQKKLFIEDSEFVDTTNILPGTVTIIENSSLDSLLISLINNPPALKGFRVRIYLGASKNNADEIRNRYLENEYQWPHYLTFREPNFIVEIGDFMTRLQAEKVKEELTLSFSNPYVVLTIINSPKYSNKGLKTN
jgi:hypothetical protein